MKSNPSIYFMLRMCAVVLLMGLYSASLNAQARDRPQPKTFKDNLWYGGSFGLGYVGGSNFSQFNFGLFPMVGYKLTPWFSVGPRLGIDYNYYKAPSASSGKLVSTNVFGVYTGVFARARIYKFIFGQVEYGVDMGAFPRFDRYGFVDVDANDKIRKQKITQEQGLVGIGYNSGGEFASEILILYDVLVAENSIFSPWNIRVGFTYKF